MPRCRVGRVLLLALLFTVVARAASAQSTIAGLVTDTTGAVLPGVTVEAASPALIEKVRTVAADGEGRYSGVLDADVAVYAQDSWTLKRLTVNPGLRHEYFKSMTF